MHKYGSLELGIKKETVEVNDQVSGKQVLLKMLAAPVAPYDISEANGWNAEGAGKLPAVCGNQGVAEVAATGDGVTGVAVGDWVVPCAGKLGTWTTLTTASEEAVTKIDKFSLKDADGKDVAAEQAAMAILPGVAAERLLTDFVPLEAGDVIVQNGAKSALGQAVLQLAAAKGIVVINVERDHPTWHESVGLWQNQNKACMSFSEPLTQTPEYARTLSDVPAPKLAIDTEGGRSGLVLAQTLGHCGSLVSVGNASGHPLPLTADVLLKKNINVTGFSLASWLSTQPKADVDAAIKASAARTAAGKQSVACVWEPFKDFSIALARAQDAAEKPVVVLMDPPSDRLQ